MKKGKIYLLLLLIAATGFTACEKKLTQTPEGVLFDNEAITDFPSLQAAILGNYSGLLSTGYYGKAYPTMLEVRGADSYITLSNSNRFLSAFRYSFTSSDGDVAAVWDAAYRVILRANNVINRSANVTDGDPAAKQQIKGEAYFLRALAYFDLVRVFGRAYTGTGNTPANDLGVPLVTSFQIGNPSRSTVAQVYIAIINDLLQAKQLLPNDPSTKFRATTMAASALLARVYIYHGDNALAVTEATRVINSGEYSLTDPTLYGSGVFWNTPGGDEEIFTIKVSQFQDAGADNFGALFNPTFEAGYGDIRVYPSFANTYLLGDARLGIIIQNPDDGQLYNQKFKTQDNIFGLTSFKLLRLAEMYFIRAEANVKLTSPALAVTDLSTVRNARGLPVYVGVPTVSNVLDEKNWEFAFEGHQWQDKLRNNLVTTRPSYSDVTGLAGSQALPVNSSKQLWPIPQAEIDANTGIKNQQNPGY